MFLARSFIVYIIIALPASALFGDWIQSDWSGGVGGNPQEQYNKIENISVEVDGVTTSSASGWKDPAWKSRKKILISNAHLTETLVNFPIYVELNENNFDFEKVMAENLGSDLRFVSSAGEYLPFEIEFWELGNQKAGLWVKIPLITTPPDKPFIYLYYNNSSEEIDSGVQVNQVWDEGFKGVWHFNLNPEVDERMNDSTSHRNHAKFSNSIQTSLDPLLGKGLHFDKDGGSDIVYVARSEMPTKSLDIEGRVITVEAWVNPIALNEQINYVVARLDGEGTSPGSGGIVLGILGDTSSGQTWKERSVYFKLNLGENNAGPWVAWEAVNLKVEKGKWHHIVAVYDGSKNENRVRIHLDDQVAYFSGEVVGILDPTISSTTDRDLDFNALYSLGSPPPFESHLSEVRISDVARSEEWVDTGYLNAKESILTFEKEEIISDQTGRLESVVFDTQKGAYWRQVRFSASSSELMEFRLRSSNDSLMESAPDFVQCPSLLSETLANESQCVQDGHRYVQYQATLRMVEGTAPFLSEVTILFDQNEKPNMPIAQSPADGITNQTLNPALSMSEFEDPNEKSLHKATEWYLDDDPNFSSPDWKRVAGIENETSIEEGKGTFSNSLAGKSRLDYNTTYFWRSRYQDDLGGFSDYSKRVSFKTKPVPTVDADAGLNRTLKAGSKIGLKSGTIGFGLSYRWSLVSGNGKLENADTSTPTYIAPNVEGNRNEEILLTVTNLEGRTATDTLTIHVIGSKSNELDAVDEPLIGAVQKRPIYKIDQTVENDGELEERVALVVNNIVVLLPSELSDFNFQMNSSGQLIINVPAGAESVGKIYYSLASLDDIDAEEKLELDSHFGLITGNQKDDGFGMCLEMADIDGDGTEEVLVCATKAGPNGVVYIYSKDFILSGLIVGAPEAPVHSIIASKRGFISELSADLLSGPKAMDNKLDWGTTLNLTSENVRPAFFLPGSAKFNFSVDLSSAQLAGEVDKAVVSHSVVFGDWNRDGKSDLALSTTDGEVLIFFGRLPEGSKLTRDQAKIKISGLSKESLLGFQMAAADVTADASQDLIMSAPGYGDARQGAVFVLMGPLVEDQEINLEDSSIAVKAVCDEAEQECGVDMVLADADANGVSEIYITQGESKIKKVDLTSAKSVVATLHETLDDLKGKNDAQEAQPVAGGGCQLVASENKNNYFIWVFILLLPYWIIRSIRSEIS